MCLKVNMRVTGFVANCAVDDANAAYDPSNDFLNMTRPSTPQT